MVIFVGDTHFGHGTERQDRAHEESLIACLLHYQARVTHLVLIGDIFDAYIEHRFLMPKVSVRLMSLLLKWTDRGIDVTYLIGNHDLWHRDYFATEMGVHMVPGYTVVRKEDAECYLRHGDGIGHIARPVRWFQGLLRNRCLVWLYRNLLPADLGVALARTVSQALRHRAPNPRTASDLRHYARQTLRHTSAQVVIMGHSHAAELVRWPEGTYLNPGSFRDEATFGVMESGHVRLVQWHCGRPVIKTTAACS